MEERRNIRDAIAEAQGVKHEFDAKARATFIRDMVRQIEVFQAEGKTVQEIKTLLPVFFRDYKNLFEMVTQPQGYNKESLNTMLAMLDRMGAGDLTQHQASVIVGKRLADKYIKPE